MRPFGRFLAATAAATAVLFWTAQGSNAQTTFRPGTEEARLSAQATGLADRALLRTAEALSIISTEPETHEPLPQARRIMDELVESGNLQDRWLSNAWRNIEPITARIDAAVTECRPELVRQRIARLREFGEDVRQHSGEIANLRDRLVDLYNDDMAEYMRRVQRIEAAAEGMPPLLEGIAQRSGRYGVSKTAEFLSTWQRASAGVQAAGRATRSILGPLAAVQTLHDSIVAADMSYNAFIAARRLPHILEKYEMIAYLGELAGSHLELIDMINIVLTNVAADYEEHCNCGIDLGVGADLLDRTWRGPQVALRHWRSILNRAYGEPFSDEQQLLIHEARDRVRAYRSEVNRLEAARRRIDEQRRQRATEPDRLRADFERFRQRRQAASEQEALRRQIRDYERQRRERRDYRRERERGPEPAWRRRG